MCGPFSGPAPMVSKRLCLPKHGVRRDFQETLAWLSADCSPFSIFYSPSRLRPQPRSSWPEWGTQRAKGLCPSLPVPSG